jgi:hypothetical protein
VIVIDSSNATPEALALAEGLKAQWAGIGQFGPQLGTLIVDNFGYRQAETAKPGTVRSSADPSAEAQELAGKIAGHHQALGMMAPHIAYVAVDHLGYRKIA